MQVWTKFFRRNGRKIQNSLPFYKFYRRLANSNTTNEALNCTVYIAADSIVNTISFIIGVLFCDPKHVLAKSGSGEIWVPKIWPDPAPADLKKSNPVHPYMIQCWETGCPYCWGTKLFSRFHYCCQQFWKSNPKTWTNTFCWLVEAGSWLKD